MSNLKHRNNPLDNWKTLRASFFLPCLALVCAWCGSTGAQTVPLYEDIPYDLVTLDERNDSVALKVKSLEFPNHVAPSPLPKSGMLKVRLLDQPGEDYEIAYTDIARIETFEQLILKEGKIKIALGQTEEAYDYLSFLRSVDKRFPGLDAAFDSLLMEEAGQFREQGDYAAALARLRELHERSPNRSDLKDAWGEIIEEILEGYEKQGDFDSLRRMIQQSRTEFPDHPVADKWTDLLVARASGHLDQVERALADGDWRKAYAQCESAYRLWPDLPNLHATWDDIRRDYPRIVVGVSQIASRVEPRSVADWGARREHRLVRRSLTEFVGPDVEGGKYVCPLGQMTIDNARGRIEWRLLDGLAWSGQDAGPITAADLARTLASLPESLAGNGLHDWIGGVETLGLDGVRITLARPTIRPEAWLGVDVVPRRRATLLEAGQAPPSEEELADAAKEAEQQRHAVGRYALGPYLPATVTEDEAVFHRNEGYFLDVSGAPGEIRERRFNTGREGLVALREYRIDVLDRVNPWDRDELLRSSDIVVQRYDLPLVHCLVPNTSHPLLSRRDFRRALVYATNRDGILHSIWGKETDRDCFPVSAPIMAGISSEDALSYAYDRAVEPRPYRPVLAAALSRITALNIARGKEASADAVLDDIVDEDTIEEPGENAAEDVPADPADAAAPIEIPELVLAHPPHDIARLTCSAIEKQWELVGIPVRLVETAPDCSEMPEDADLWYVELAMWEPMTDIPRLLAPGGLVGPGNAYIEQQLDGLREAADWAEIGGRLRTVHRLLHHDVSVIPLWQMPDYFAYRKGVEGISQRPVRLYQEVEQWRITPVAVGETP